MIQNAITLKLLRLFDKLFDVKNEDLFLKDSSFCLNFTNLNGQVFNYQVHFDEYIYVSWIMDELTNNYKNSGRV